MKIYSGRRIKSERDVFEQLLGTNKYVLIEYHEGFGSETMWVHPLEQYFNAGRIYYIADVIYVYSSDIFKPRTVPRDLEREGGVKHLRQDYMKLPKSTEFMTTCELYRSLKWKSH